MEKPVSNNNPDFKEIANRIYPLRNNNYDFSHTKAFVKGCEHVWNTHVVPLQDQSSITIDRIESENDSYKRRYNQLESENKALREEISDKSKTCADLTILLSKEMEKVNKLEEEIERLKINQPPFR